jgi:hypothetical protein
MAIEEPPSPAPSPAKKRKVKVERAVVKSWAKCQKAKFPDWLKEDYLEEFGMSNAEWDVLDAQVRHGAPPPLTADEKAS